MTAPRLSPPVRAAGVHGRDAHSPAPSPVDPAIPWLNPAEAARLARRWWGEDPRDCEEDCATACQYGCDEDPPLTHRLRRPRPH